MSKTKMTELFYLFFTFQGPRPLSQLDLEKALSTSRNTKVAANEYRGLNLPSPSNWTYSGESGDYQLQAAINDISKLVVSHMVNLNLQSDAQDP